MPKTKKKRLVYCGSYKTCINFKLKCNICLRSINKPDLYLERTLEELK